VFFVNAAWADDVTLAFQQNPLEVEEGTGSDAVVIVTNSGTESIEWQWVKMGGNATIAEWQLVSTIFGIPGKRVYVDTVSVRTGPAAKVGDSTTLRLGMQNPKTHVIYAEATLTVEIVTPTYNLAVHVLDPENRDLAGALVSVENRETHEILLRTTDSSGWVGFYGLPRADYKVSASYEGMMFGNDYVWLSRSQDVTLGAIALPKTGELLVTIEPEEVRSNAQWQVDGGSWHHSGDLESLEEGPHTVSFKETPGWRSPGDETVNIVTGQRTEVTSLYQLVEPEKGKLPFPLEAGWNAVGIPSGNPPLTPEDIAHAVGAEIIVKRYTPQSGWQTVGLRENLAGLGVFVKSPIPAAADSDPTGPPDPGGAKEIPLSAGWNLVAVPTREILIFRPEIWEVSAGRGTRLALNQPEVTTMILPVLWLWDAAQKRYTTIQNHGDRIENYWAVWILALRDCTLHIEG
jgi:hypothetical protein